MNYKHKTNPTIGGAALRAAPQFLGFDFFA
jgi:hypothetical protein